MDNYENNRGAVAPDADFSITPADLAVNPTKQEPQIDADELAVAEQEAAASDDVFAYTFKKPIHHDNLVVEKITFDWDLLTGQDSLDIENELQALGKMVVVPAFSGEYLIRMAARASTPRVGADFFMRLPLGEYNKIRSAARSFLLKSE